jgi:hypothetical protein
MCEHCKSQKIESVGVEKGQKCCQWNEYSRRQQPYQPDITKVVAEDCCQPATQKVRNRRPLAHLCEVHKYCSAKEYQLIQEREPELNEIREYLPIQGFRCEAVVQVKSLAKDGEQPGDDGILRCGKPATHLETYWQEMYFCDEHARAYWAADEEGNSDDLQHGRFLFNNKIAPNNVICARKGCGKTGEGNLPHLPEGWRVILVAPGTIFKGSIRVQANWGGALCPEHAKELNNLLINLPGNAFCE